MVIPKLNILIVHLKINTMLILKASEFNQISNLVIPNSNQVLGASTELI